MDSHPVRIEGMGCLVNIGWAILGMLGVVVLALNEIGTLLQTAECVP